MTNSLRMGDRNCQWVGGHRTTPLRKLIKALPDVAVEVFDRCSPDNGLSPDVLIPALLSLGHGQNVDFGGP